MNTRSRMMLPLLALALGGTAQSQVPAAPAPTATPIDFATLDKDTNGKLTKAETLPVAELEGLFDSLDADHDGSLSTAEFAHWPRAGKTGAPRDPATAPGGSAGAQHMPKRD